MGRACAEAVKIASLLDKLESWYGPVRYRTRFDPMEELVSCILSQHTSDTSSFPAFMKLRERYPSWDQVIAAPVQEVAETIKSAGLSNQKAKGIQKCLSAIFADRGDFDLGFLRGLPMRQAREWLEKLPMVGPKTAAIVMSFSLGMPAIPVDTHIFRVSRRLGLVLEADNEAKAHDVLLQKVAPEDAFRYHCLLIEHGRKVCRAQKPRCEACPISSDCPSAFIVGRAANKVR